MRRKDNKEYALERRRARRYKQVYGITIEQYDKMFAEQNGKCAICLVDQKDYDKRFSVDHSHVSLRVRGILCPVCNRMICGIIDRRAKSKKVHLTELELVQRIFDYYRRAV